MAKKRKRKQRAAKPVVKRGREKLDYAAALNKASKGGTLINIARAAGSKARTRHDLSQTGARILKTLRDRGAVFETFDRLGYDVERFCKQVIDQTEAQKVSRISFEGQYTDEATDIDWGARCAAREQYMRAIGLTELEPLGKGTTPSPLNGMNDEELFNLVAGIAARAGIEGAGGGATPATRA